VKDHSTASGFELSKNQTGLDGLTPWWIHYRAK